MSLKFTGDWRSSVMITYHSDADGVIKLVHENADDGRRQQQQDERIFELEAEKQRQRL